ncbi:hypothetical protein T484DRAFT_1839748 [Baffinella frigidus]|nr:hypothetical protein T484DRAFT_1839748 [Cryptophyta sp. CCMP2293]
MAKNAAGRMAAAASGQRPCVVGGEDSLLGHVFGQQAELFVSVVCRTGGLRSVLMLSETCRLFRFLARDPMVWRELCLFAWSGEGR